MRWKLAVVATGIGLAAYLGGCDDGGGGGGGQDGGSDAGIPQNLFRPGMGEDEGDLVGLPFVLPQGVTVDGIVLGARSDGGCAGTGLPAVGQGKAVQVCVPLRNDRELSFDLPAGLTVVPRNRSYQSGILLRRGQVFLPFDGGVQKVPLHLWCLNELRLPSEVSEEYDLSVVSSDPDVQELMQLLEGKVLDSQQDVQLVQESLWHITEGTGLTADDRARLRAL